MHRVCVTCKKLVLLFFIIIIITTFAPIDTGYQWWSCHSGSGKLYRNDQPPAMGAKFTVFATNRPCGPAGWLALLLIKVGDFDTNPGPKTTRK